MKYLYTLLIFLFSMVLYAQAPAASASSSSDFKTVLAQSETYFLQGDYAAAAEQAGKAVGLAERMKNPDWLALAKFMEGRALARQGGRRRGQASQALDRGYRIALSNGNLELATQILQQQRQIALERGKDREAEKIDKRLDGVQEQTDGALSSFAMPPPPGTPNLMDKIEELDEALSIQEEETQEMTRERKALEHTIEQQQLAIQAMNESQAKARLTLEYQQRLVDSLTFHNLADSLQLANQAILLRQQEGQVKLKNSQRNLSVALAAFVLAISLGLLLRFLQVRAQSRALAEKNQLIQEERKRSDALLLNILPASIAEELKKKGWASARHYEQATVLFADFKNFTGIAELLPPAELVSELDYCFRAFDRIIEKYNLEKIKTIGDSYMLAGGLPEYDTQHTCQVVRAAFEMIEFLETYNKERQEKQLPLFEVRIGIHTGPLVAGVVGEKKFAYDVWGDTVNIASRMESAGAVGRINVSDSTYQLIRNAFPCSYRGKVQVKHKGEIDMYFVEPVPQPV